MAAALLPSWEIFFGEIETFIATLERQAGTASEEFSRYAIERLEVCIVNVSRLLTLLRNPSPPASPLHESTIVVEYCAQLSQLVQCLLIISLEWQGYLEVIELRSLQSAYRVGHAQSAIGRPRFDISRDQLEYLSSMCFNWTQIANMLGVSRMTIYRRRVEFEMDHSVNSNVTDEELAVILRQMRRESPALV